ncbi:hypothetical protein ABIC10_009347 [Bradyrhizobium sp. S3.2.12]
MPYRLESHGSDKAIRCAVCERKFGLVRHYSWWTPLCSKNCVDRFKERRQGDQNWDGLVPNRFRPVARKPRGGGMTLPISQRANEYLKSAQSLLRAAKTVTDQAIATQLQARADDYARRAEGFARRCKALLDPLLALNRSGIHELLGSFPQYVWRHACRSGSRSNNSPGVPLVFVLTATITIRDGKDAPNGTLPQRVRTDSRRASSD